MMKIKKLAAVVLFAFVSIVSWSQCDSIAFRCQHNMPNDYISDGQNYWALLYNDQVAEFDVSLFGGSVYRICACSGEEDGNLIFSLFDQDKNLLFTNRDHSNAPYWDFVVDSTIDCKLEAQLDLNRRESGCAVILMGFKH
jgi:hypothetical protein